MNVDVVVIGVWLIDWLIVYNNCSLLVMFVFAASVFNVSAFARYVDFVAASLLFLYVFLSVLMFDVKLFLLFDVFNVLVLLMV